MSDNSIHHIRVTHKPDGLIYPEEWYVDIFCGLIKRYRRVATFGESEADAITFAQFKSNQMGLPWKKEK
jgi:hypothetical protein